MNYRTLLGRELKTVIHNNGLPLISALKGSRNYLCFCGSGLKFKKCHEGKINNYKKSSDPSNDK